MDIIVIGAGAAGLSAARALQDAGENVVVLEATDRIGGRIYTDRSICDIPIELGAEFIHGSEVATWEWVKRLGLNTVAWRKTDDSMVRLADGSWQTMSEARQKNADFDQTRTWELPYQAVLEDDEDWGTYLKRCGFTDEQMRYVERTFANAVGDAMRYIGAKAILKRIQFTGDGAGDFRILEGYDRFIEALGSGLDVRLNTPVQAISWDSGVVVETENERFEAYNAVVAVPLGVLQQEKIKFSPELPSDKRKSLKQLKMGAALKMVYVFEEAIIDANVMAIYSDGIPPMWWSPSFGHDVDYCVWTAFATGDYARQLLEMGNDKALQVGLDSLRQEIGQPDLMPTKMFLMDWVNAPYTGGGYSVAMPDGEMARGCLAEPTPPLFWAGEATAHNTQAATVHGAYLSGIRAAQEILTFKK